MTKLAAAALVLLAAVVESFSTVMLEAMSVGVAVIAAASTGAREIVTRGDNVLVFPIGDVTGLVEGLRLLAHDSALRMKIGSAARRPLAERRCLEAHMCAKNSLWQTVASAGQ